MNKEMGREERVGGPATGLLRLARETVKAPPDRIIGGETTGARSERLSLLEQRIRNTRGDGPRRASIEVLLSGLAAARGSGLCLGWVPLPLPPGAEAFFVHGAPRSKPSPEMRSVPNVSTRNARERERQG